jgi:CRISPR-associated protein Csx10
MKTYLVTATVVDEVCIAERHGAGNQYLSLDYIPGITLWGAVAALTGLRRREQPPEWFRRVFYSGEAIFTNLHPSDGAVRAHPVPLSARTLKSAPGFGNGDAEPLLRDFKAELFPGGVVNWLAGEPDPRIPPKCPRGVVDWLYNGPPSHFDPDWEPLRGWYVDNPPDCRSVSVKMVLRGHNDRAGRSGITREGLLFTRQNIARGQRFKGALRAYTPEGEQALEELVQKHLGGLSFEIPIGRQPGCVQIELEDIEGVPPYWQRDLNMEDDSILTVTLLSDALLFDPWLRPLSYLPPEEVAVALGLGRATVEGPLYHFSALREISSWNGVYSRPRETELAVTAGSSFLYLVSWPQDISVDERVRRLSAWQQRGIGLRTAEGFGEIRINDPFHREYQGDGQNAGRNE